MWNSLSHLSLAKDASTVLTAISFGSSIGHGIESHQPLLFFFILVVLISVIWTVQFVYWTNKPHYLLSFLSVILMDFEKIYEKCPKNAAPIDLILCTCMGPQYMIQTIQSSHIHAKLQNVKFHKLDAHGFWEACEK